MAAGDTARLYHRLTSYDSGREWDAPVDHPAVLTDFQANDLARFPAHCKTYPVDLPVVELPRSWPSEGGSATAVLAGRHTAPPATLTIARLARLLHLSAGVVRLAKRKDGRRYRFRAAGSAGGQFPFELYVAARGVPGLIDGVHWFDPLNHAVAQVGPAPEGEASTFVVTGVPWRTGWRYAERGFRHLYWDAGGILANTLSVGTDVGLAPRLRSVFPDVAVTRLVGADGVHEFPLAIVTFGAGEPAIGPAGATAGGDVDERAPVEFPLITAVQHAGDGERLGDPWPLGAPLTGALPDSGGLDEVILRRISTRAMAASRSVGREVFEWSLTVALRGSQMPHFIAVHAVEGLEPGLYRWPLLDAPLRRGDLREDLFRVCDHQPLPRDASFVVITAVDADQLDDRAYREAQLDAGLVSGRLHLAAFALGIGATGMTFVDSELPGLLGEPLEGLLLTCVGVPTYWHRPGGPPGAPTKMRPLKQPSS